MPDLKLHQETLPNGVCYIEAEGFQILDRGARILFTGKARLVMYPAAGG